MDDKYKEFIETLRNNAKDSNKQDGGVMLLVVDMYERVFKMRKKKSRCCSCMLGDLNELEKAYEAACDE